MTDPPQQPQTPQPDMHHSPQPPVSGPPTMAFVPAPPAPAKSRRLVWALVGGAIALVVVVGTTVGVTLVATSDGGSPNAAATTKAPTSWSLEQETGAEPDIEDESNIGATPEAEPSAGPTPRAANIELAPKITDKQCFGSAGCNVQFKVELGYGGPALSEDETWEVTYEVRGGEDGPIIGTLEMTGDKYTVQEEMLSTPRNSTKLKIKVTDVEKLGY